MKAGRMGTFAVIAALAPAVLASPAQAAKRITEFPIPSPFTGPEGITEGPDGNVWFTEWSGNRIGRMTLDGTVTEWDVPTPNSYPHTIVTGPDGNLWFTEQYGSTVGTITPQGTFAEYPLPAWTSYLYGITVGPDGNLWFAAGNKL